MATGLKGWSRASPPKIEVSTGVAAPSCPSRIGTEADLVSSNAVEILVTRFFLAFSVQSNAGFLPGYDQDPISHFRTFSSVLVVDRMLASRHGSAPASFARLPVS